MNAHPSDSQVLTQPQSADTSVIALISSFSCRCCRPTPRPIGGLAVPYTTVRKHLPDRRVLRYVKAIVKSALIVARVLCSQTVSADHPSDAATGPWAALGVDSCLIYALALPPYYPSGLLKNIAEPFSLPKIYQNAYISTLNFKIF